MSALNARNAAALARVRAADGGYSMPSGEPVVGREALERFWSQSQGRGLELELERFEAEGAVAWAVGRWTIGVENASGASGRFVLALRRNAAGEFEIVVDLNNEARS
jgi:ketosteroid isomerase-like protein